MYMLTCQSKGDKRYERKEIFKKKNLICRTVFDNAGSYVTN